MNEHDERSTTTARVSRSAVRSASSMSMACVRLSSPSTRMTATSHCRRSTSILVCGPFVITR